MSRGRKKRTLRDLNIEGPTSEEIGLIFTEIGGSTDRNAAILACSSVEWRLGQLIIKKLPNVTAESSRKLFDLNGLLSTLYTANQLGLALGLYDKVISNNLDIIRRVRNSFAHAPKPITFRTAEVSKECQKLIIGKVKEFVPIFYEHGIGGSVTPRFQFVNACVELFFLFTRQLIRLNQNEIRRARYRKKK